MVRQDAYIAVPTIDKLSHDFKTVIVAYSGVKIGSTKWNNDFSRGKSSSIAEKDKSLKNKTLDKSNSFLKTLNSKPSGADLIDQI